VRISIVVSPLFMTTVALTMLSACSGGNSQMAPTLLAPESRAAAGSAQAEVSQNDVINNLRNRRRTIASGQAVMRPSFFNANAKGKHLVFGADGVSNVYIYLQNDKNQKMVGQISGLTYPAGLASDTGGDLYVAGNDTVPVYAPPYTGAPKSTLNDPGYYSQAVALSPTGVVAVTNFCNAPSCSTGTGNVVFYAQNSTTPCATVADPNFATPLYDAFDEKGNLYITAISADGGHTIGEIKGNCKAKKIALLATSNGIGAIGGIEVDKADRIAILGKGGSNYDVLDVYKAPKNGSLGNPLSVTEIVTPALPIDFAFSASGADVYTAEEESTGGLLNSYDFPAGGSAENSITIGTGTPLGVAVTPPVFP
jgi:hypothetical protein